jgi:hypothetical protein
MSPYEKYNFAIDLAAGRRVWHQPWMDELV